MYYLSLSEEDENSICQTFGHLIFLSDLFLPMYHDDKTARIANDPSPKSKHVQKVRQKKSKKF